MWVHDVTNSKPRCLLEAAVEAGRAVTFARDTLESAHAAGFSSCPFCLGPDVESWPDVT